MRHLLLFCSFMQIYDEYCPILLNQFKSRDCLKFETFDAALDEFYSKIESQRSEQQQKAKEGSAMQKLDKIRMDQVYISFCTCYITFQDGNIGLWFMLRAFLFFRTCHVKDVLLLKSDPESSRIVIVREHVLPPSSEGLFSR